MLKRGRRALSGEDIVAAISESGLRGRGGAGFPTGRKASFLAPADARATSWSTPTSPSRAPFKDREIMLRNPHAMLEGILIMSWAVRRPRRSSTSAAST